MADHITTERVETPERKAAKMSRGSRRRSRGFLSPPKAESRGQSLWLKIVLSRPERCQQPGVEVCAREWQADMNRRHLEALGLAEEFVGGCDAIADVGQALLDARDEIQRLKGKK